MYKQNIRTLSTYGWRRKTNKAGRVKRWAIRPQGDVRVGWVGGFWLSGWKKDALFSASPRGGIGFPVYRAPNGQLQGGISVVSSPPGRGAQSGNGYYPPPDQVGG